MGHGACVDNVVVVGVVPKKCQTCFLILFC